MRLVLTMRHGVYTTLVSFPRTRIPEQAWTNAHRCSVQFTLDSGLDGCTGTGNQSFRDQTVENT
jgi:hypothetical protein